MKLFKKHSVLIKFGLGASIAGLTLAGVACLSSDISRQSAKQRQTRMEASPQWKDGVFGNRLVEKNNMGLGVIWRTLTSKAQSVPTQALPLINRTAADFAAPPASGLRTTWLGHSTILLEIDGSRVLLDPVWGKRVSPLSWIGPARFHAPPLPLEELLKLKLDAVVISHNHYDHLDEPTMRALAKTNTRFFVPLGVGKRLEGWGIKAKRITELDWWQSARAGSVKLTATPARHFSGRSLTDRNKTLWASWAIRGPKHNAFFSGDTAMHPEFKTIGERLGPFDLTMMETGAYNAAWRDVHMGPEQAVQAHKDLRGKTMLPIHWGTFDLAMHAWTEPVERTIAAAQKAGVSLTTPKPGQSFEPTRGVQVARWWPALPWQNAAQAPVISTGLTDNKTVISSNGNNDTAQ